MIINDYVNAAACVRMRVYSNDIYIIENARQQQDSQ